MVSFSLISLITLCLVSPLVNAALVPRASTTCTYACPTMDNGSRMLQSSADAGAQNQRLRCTYQVTPDKNCVYTKSTGVLFNDNDGGDCPANALCNAAKRSAKPALPVRRALAANERVAAGKKVDMSRFKNRK